MSLDAGMIFASDSRTNAGVDQIARFSKMKVFAAEGQRVIVTLCSGNLSITQNALSIFEQKARAGDNEMHLAFTVDDYEAAHHSHQEMGIICYENPAMGIYFIEDPDGYWLEILPPGRG